jgi:hypothetical protein
MNHENFRKLIKLFEDRRDDVDYEDDDTQATANLGGYQSQSYTKLGQKIAEIERKQKEIDQLKQEVKADTREYIADLFDAADAVKTRVVRTKSFYFQLSKDPAPTVSPKYKEILTALEEHLTPQLLEVLSKLKEELVTVTQKAPSLKSRPLDEGEHSGFTAQINSWADSYDRALDTLERELDGVEQGVSEGNTEEKDPVWNKGTPMPLDYTCHCGLYVHPRRRKPDARHISDCPYAKKQDVSEGYWDDAVKNAEQARAARQGKPFEPNPASHDENGTYKGDKDLAGNYVPNVQVGDQGHLGFGSKGGAGFNGVIEKVEDDKVYVRNAEGKLYKGPARFWTPAAVNEADILDTGVGVTDGTRDMLRGCRRSNGTYVLTEKEVARLLEELDFLRGLVDRLNNARTS